MPAASTHERWTAEMVRALPDDGNRYEVVDGVLLVSPSPRAVHQRAVTLLVARLVTFTREHRIGDTLVSPADIEFAPDTLVQPDVFVAPLVNGRAPMSWTEITELLLAVEVLSPSTARSDRLIKRRLYQKQGVRDYWIVDCDARTIEHWGPHDERPEICDASISWKASDDGPALSLDVAAFFAEVFDEG